MVSNYSEGLISKMKLFTSPTPSFSRKISAAVSESLPPSARTSRPSRRNPGHTSPPSGITPQSPSIAQRWAFPILALVAVMAFGLLFLLPGGLLHAQESASIEYAENRTDPVATYTAVDPEMTEIVSWTLAGTDAANFTIEGGVLTFKESPDYEMAMDEGTDKMYSVTVQATDETNKVGMKEVMVEVTNVDEMGMVTLSALRPQSATAFTATLTDPDIGISGTTWQWAKASSRNGSYRDIDDNADNRGPTRRLTPT